MDRKVDGKDYPVSGGVNEETRAYTKVDDRTLEFVGKSGGKVTVKGRVSIKPGAVQVVISSQSDMVPLICERDHGII